MYSSQDSLPGTQPFAPLCVTWVLLGLHGLPTGRPVSSCLFFKRKNVGPAVEHCGFTKLTLIRRLMRDREGRGVDVVYVEVHIVYVFLIFFFFFLCCTDCMITAGDVDSLN